MSRTSHHHPPPGLRDASVCKQSLRVPWGFPRKVSVLLGFGLGFVRREDAGVIGLGRAIVIVSYSHWAAQKWIHTQKRRESYVSLNQIRQHKKKKMNDKSAHVGRT
jgi:hypothetical protein